MPARRLTLNGERLTELTTDELGGVVGGTLSRTLTACDVHTLPLYACFPTMYCAGRA